MKIALYLNNLWGISATARIAHFLATEFKKRGHWVEFIVNKPPVEIAKEFPIKVLKSKGDLSRALELGKILKGEKFDVCLAFMRPQSVVLGLLRLLKPNLKTALVASVHNSDNYLSYNKHYQVPYRYLVKFLLEKNCKIVAVSQTVKRDLEEAFFLNPNKIEVIYNPIDINKIRELANEPLDPQEEEIFKNPVIVNVARMETQKGLHHLVNIFKRVNRKLPQTGLVLIGNGSLRKDLENQVQKLGLEEKVHFLGWKENPFKYVKRSKVFALTSLWEGLPMVVLETLALNIPIVAFKTRGGHVEVLENCCPLVDYPNEEQFTEVLIKLLTEESFYRQIQQKEKEKIELFRVENIANQYLELFESCLGG